MLKKIETRDLPSIALVTGLCGLLCFNVAVGLTKGFDRPDGGLLVRLLASPGIALGWGGVLLLVVAIPYALLAWIRGRRAGKLLSIGGAVVFAVATGALVAVFTSPASAGGGRIGGAVGAYLHGSFGSALAAVALLVVSVPALLLSLAPLILESGVARNVDRVQKDGAAPKPWYPERKVGVDGVDEEPVQFKNSHDVGPIRFRDEIEGTPTPQPAASTVSLSPPPVAGPAARKHKAIAGIRFADEMPDATGAAVAAAEGAAWSPVQNGENGVNGTADSQTAAETDVRAAAPVKEVAKEPALPNGIRYADEAPATYFPEPPAALEDAPPTNVEQAAFAQNEPLPVAEHVPFAETPPSRDEDSDAVESARALLSAADPHSAPTSPTAPAASTPLPQSPAPERPAAAAMPMAPAPAALAATPAAGTTFERVSPTTSERVFALTAAAAASASSPARSGARRSPPKSQAAAIAAALDLEMPDAGGVATAAAPSTETQDAETSGELYRRKLASTGLIEAGPQGVATSSVVRTPRARPRPARPKDVHDAIRGLFSSLPLDELPPVMPVIDPPEAAPAPPPMDAPGQTVLPFDVASKSRGRRPQSDDPLFRPSVDAAIERGSASLVLLKRKLGVGYARAATLIEALVAEGILGEMTASGSRPTLLTAAEWERRSKAISAR